MIKEAKNIDFYTTGRQPSEQDFTRISKLIKREKQKKLLHKQAQNQQGKESFPKSIIKSED